MGNNPRSANGNMRRKNRARFRAMNAECGICKGRFGSIHYDEPSDAKHPLSFVIDEIVPVSKYKSFGYNSAREAAEDFNNLQAAHYYCNAIKSNKLNFSFDKLISSEGKLLPENGRNKIHLKSIPDGDW